MALWSFLAICAALLQTVRNLSSKVLTGHLHPVTISLVRFGYALPFCSLLYVICRVVDLKSGTLNGVFFAYAIAAALCQGIANSLVVSLMKRKNYLLAVNLSKTETLFSYLIGRGVFHQLFSGISTLGVMLTGCGVLLANGKGLSIRKVLQQDELLRGIGAGLFFALSGFFISFGVKEVSGGSLVMNSALFLWWCLLFQTLLLVSYTYVVRPQELIKLTRHWKTDILVGGTSAGASFCWFWAFALENVALVKAVGQVEFFFGLAFATKYMGERYKGSQIVGIFATAIGIIIVLIG